METEGSAKWTENDMKTLFGNMKRSIANRVKDKVWSTGLKDMDWEIVAFRSFTAEDCCAKWSEIMQKLRKIKTLKELIDDAESTMGICPTLFQESTIKLPKKPVAANALFFRETRKKLKEQNPGLSSRDLMKLANQQYKSLPLQSKEKYINQAEKVKEKYQRKMRKLRKHHPDELEKSRKRRQKLAEISKTKEMPSTISLNGYNLFCREQKAHMSGVPRHEITSVWSQRWRKLSTEEKEQYRRRCQEIKMAHKKTNKKFFPGEPKLKSNSICGLYCKENLKGKKEGQSNQEHFAEVSRKAKNISQKERERYQAIIDDDFRDYQDRLQKWFKDLSPKEKAEYCELKPSKVKYLQYNPPMRTSDSEDEDMEDSSSDDDTLVQLDDDNEDEDVTMFDLY